MIKAIIVDDEQHCIDRLKGLLAEHYAGKLQLLGEYDTVSKGAKAIKDLAPDLVFLDVQIHDQMGFDLLQEIGKIDFEVIFTTAYDKFAVQAFRFSALDYLLKPIDPDDLRLAINKLETKVNHNQVNRLEVLLENIRRGDKSAKKVIVPTISGFEVLEVAEIIRCQSDINYTTIFLKDRQKLVVAKTLKEFEEMLSAYNFFRVHNSHLVNLAYIKTYNRGKGGSVVLIDGTELEVSTRRKDEFLQRMAQM